MVGETFLKHVFGGDLLDRSRLAPGLLSPENTTDTTDTADVVGRKPERATPLAATKDGPSQGVEIAATGFTRTGGPGDDILRGGADDDRLDGLGGDDTILGQGGADRILGGQGDDDVRAGGGDDVVRGSGGADTLRGGGGDDTLRGGGGADSIVGGAGADRLVGGAGSDTLSGGGRSDFILAGGKNDVANGGKGADTLKGGGGEDVINGGIGSDLLEGGADSDVFVFRRKDFSAGETDVITDFALGEDKIDLRPFADAPGFSDLVFSLEDGALSLLLNRGRVEFQGLTDPAAFGADDFMLSDQSGGESGGVIVITEDGEREIRGRGGADALQGGDEDEILRAAGGADRLDGGGGDDALAGGAGTDTLIGGAGSDTLTGGGGADVFSVFAADLQGGDVDVISDLGGDDALDLRGFVRSDIDARRDGDDVVADLSVGSSSAALRIRDFTVEAFEARLDEIFGPARGGPNQTGGSGDDALDGDERANRLDGGDGADSLSGAAGADTLIGGPGDDRMTGGAGGDVFAFDKDDLDDGDLDHIVDFDPSEGDRLDFTGFDGGDVAFGLSSLGGGVDISLRLDDGAARVFLAGGDEATLAALQRGRVIEGSAAADLLVGDQGDDTVRAGSGDDVVGTSEGADELYGEDGDDVFVLSRLPEAGDPLDMIMDFSPGDRIGLRDALAGLRFAQVGDLVTIRPDEENPENAVIHMRGSTAEEFMPALIIANYGETLDGASPEAISREILAISDAVSAQSGSSGGSVYGFNNIDGTAFVSIRQVMVSFDYRYAYVHEAISFSDSYTNNFRDVDAIVTAVGGLASDLEFVANEAFVDTTAETSYIFDAYEGRVVDTDRFFTSTDISFLFGVDGLSDLTFSQSSRTGEYSESEFLSFLSGVDEAQGLANGLETYTPPDMGGEFDFDAAMDRLDEIPDFYTIVAEQGSRSILLSDDFDLIGVDLSTETVTVQDISDGFGFSAGAAFRDLSVINLDRAIASPDLGFVGLFFSGFEGSEFVVARLFDTPGIDDVADSRDHALAIGAGLDQIIFTGDEVQRSSAATRRDEDWFELPVVPGGEGYVVEARGLGDYVIEIYLGEAEAPHASGDIFAGRLQPATRFDVPADHDGPVYAMVRGFGGVDAGAYDLVFTPPQDPTGDFDTPVVLPSGSQVVDFIETGETHVYRVGSINTGPSLGIAQIRPLSDDEFEGEGVPADAGDPLLGAVLSHFAEDGTLIATSEDGELANVFSGFVGIEAGDDPTGAYVFDYL